MRKTVFLSIAIILLTLSACTSRGIHLFTVEIAGEVRESSIIHQPIRGVEIFDADGTQRGETDENGRFLIQTEARQGKVVLRFQHPDYITRSETVMINGQARTAMELPSLELQAAGAQIRGRVLRKTVPPVLPVASGPAHGSLHGTGIDVAESAVQGEYNLVTSRDREWLLNRLHGLGEIRKSASNGLYTIRVRPGADEKQMVEELRASGEIQCIEPNRYAYLLGLTPHDELYPEQWNLWMMGAEQAWEYATGNGVIVAVLDSMYTSLHPDLFSRLMSAYDANNDTRTDLYLGAHGMHVAGIIAAAADQRGIIGAAPHARILPVRVFKWGGDGREIATVDAIVRGIDYAIANGAQVINMSFGMRDPDPVLHQAIQRAYAAGIVLVAASGNNGNAEVLYPAAYPEVIAVGAVGPDGKRAEYSQYGSGMELMAPGGNSRFGENGEILSTYWDIDSQQYTWAYMEGTSMAAPHVSAIAALLKSYGITDPDYIRLLLRDTAQDMDKPGYDEKTGYGRVDAFAVMDRFQHTYVFFGEIRSGYAQLKSMVAHVQTNGDFALSGVHSGTGYVVGWIDINHNLMIDGGDYLGQSAELGIPDGAEQISDIQVEMSMVPGTFHAVDLNLQAP